MATVAPAAEKPIAPPTRGRAQVFKVQQPSGGSFEVATADERKFYQDQQKKYLAENKFTAATDLADLDRLLFQELLDYRWTVQLGKGKSYDDYDLAPAIEEQYRRNKNDAAKVIAQIKNDLGMTRAVRDSQMDSPADFVKNLLIRAKEFGVHRNKQVIEALVLFNRLKSIVGTFDRSNAVERTKVGIETEADIVDWIRTEAIPQFDAIDDAWRSGTQKYWSGETV